MELPRVLILPQSQENEEEERKAMKVKQRPREVSVILEAALLSDETTTKGKTSCAMS